MHMVFICAAPRVLASDAKQSGGMQDEGKDQAGAGCWLAGVGSGAGTGTVSDGGGTGRIDVGARCGGGRRASPGGGVAAAAGRPLPAGAVLNMGKSVGEGEKM